MEHKAWLWRKKSTEKAVLTTDKVNLSSEEVEALLTDKAELERDLKILNDKLSSTLSECRAKDDLVKKHAKMAQEAIGDWENAEAEAVSLKQKLDIALQKKVVGEERLNQLDAALKECMQQLRFVRDEQEQKVNDAVMKTSREFEKTRIYLEDKLAETSKRLAKLGAENTNLSKALLAKEKFIEDLNEHKTRAEADFNALMTRLDSTEKDNASLKYEVRVLEKELEIRNEEREFSRRTADISHKQHLENVKKIAKLDSECQRLRLLVRKRLPGPAALAKMKNEVEMLEKDSAEVRRRKLNPAPIGSIDLALANSPDTPSKKINILTEQLCAMEEENKTLKESLDKMITELQCSKIMYSRTAEAHLEEPLKWQTAMDPTKNILFPRQHSMVSMSDIDSDDKVSYTESWASAPFSELEHLRNGKQKGRLSCKSVVSDINLMDDFVEMEKLALASVGKPLESESSEYSSEATGRELVLVDFLDARESSNHLDASIPLHGVMPNKSSVVDSSKGVTNSTIEKKNQQFQSSMSKSICRIVELLEGINLISPDHDTPETLPGKDGSFCAYKNLETPTGYMVRVFQWKTSEVSDVLQQFLRTCNDLLNGKVDIEGFTRELTCALDWIMNHCFSLQDVSSMRDSIKKHYGWDDTRSEIEAEIVAASNDHNNISQMEDREEIRRLKDELMNLESTQKDLEGMLHSAIDQSETSMIQLQQSEKTISSLKKELESLKESKEMIEEQFGNYKLLNVDLDRQLKVARDELTEVREKFSLVEMEMENKNNCCQELEATCLELQLQLQSVMKKDIPNYNMDQEEKQQRNDWEMTAASEKLAECQETILNLGKQLKALASPREAALFDKVISTPSDTPKKKKMMSQRSSLLERMLADDAEASKFPKTKEIICTTNGIQKPPAPVDGNSNSALGLVLNGNRQRENEAIVDSSAIVPCKKKGSGGLLRMLFWKRKKRYQQEILRV